MSAVVGNTGVLVDLSAAYNPGNLPANKNCYIFDPATGNVTASNDANCDATFVASGSATSNKVCVQQSRISRCLARKTFSAKYFFSSMYEATTLYPVWIRYYPDSPNNFSPYDISPNDFSPNDVSPHSVSPNNIFPKRCFPTQRFRKQHFPQTTVPQKSQKRDPTLLGVRTLI
jgi:hypothetical protein